MKCIIPEISWNNRDPVFSLDIQPKIDEFTRLATAGSDTHIVIWHLTIVESTGSINIDVAADLNKHQKAVNVVRWSPSGELLAAGDDESNIILWKQRSSTNMNDHQLLSSDKDTTSEITNELMNNTNDEQYKECWYIYKILRGHMDDVYDISWSPDSKQLLSGSVDNTAIVWNVTNKTKHILQPNHKGFVQGVAWDPLNQYTATLSSDRVCRVFDVHTKRLISKSSKGTLPFTDTSSPLYGHTCRLYHDDTLKSYFRRLTFSPDGKLLIAPAGCVQSEHCPNKIHFTYIYTRYSFKQPTLALPSPDQFTVAVRCCPILFELRVDGPQPPMIPLPYRMIIAVASQTTITFYDTQQCEPFATITNVHYTRITDIAWSSNGQIVAVSSTDGFCSLILFKASELGIQYHQQKQSSSVSLSSSNSVDADDNLHKENHHISMMDIDDNNCDEVTTTSSQDIQLHLENDESDDRNLSITADNDDHTTTTEVTNNDDHTTTTSDNDNDKECTIDENTSKTPCTTDTNTPKPPRRVTFITLSSPKSKKKIL